MVDLIQILYFIHWSLPNSSPLKALNPNRKFDLLFKISCGFLDAKEMTGPF